MVAGVTQIGLSYTTGGIGHCIVYRRSTGLPEILEFVDWPADPKYGKVFQPPQDAQCYFLFAILPREKEYFDRTWTLERFVVAHPSVW